VNVEQQHWTAADGWRRVNGPALSDNGGNSSSAADLVFVFGSGAALSDSARLDDVRRMFPGAPIAGCSTAGEICGTRVHDDSLVVTAIDFAHTTVRLARVNIGDVTSSFDAGRRLAAALDPRGLTHAFVLSDGLKVNGSDLVKGLTETLPKGVTVSGGLSGDGARFQRTLVCANDGEFTPGTIAIAGFYGERLSIGCASMGGWDSFGPERVVTKSEGNVLHELDGRSALDLYKTYLGEHAAGLPASGLLFPLSVRLSRNDSGVVRTILAVDEQKKTMTFAGDLPQGAYARLMKANADRLVDGATAAARASGERTSGDGASPPQLAILISCVGRKLVLKQRVEDEVDAVREVLGPATALTGFYSYGEISPFTPSAKCELHNQTMTITTFREQ
jgi:hypothetical protein